ncbi:MAG: hypothetical protein JRN39_05045 [Nitrososphaerota archaeon]|nr:hypothetical protein [Nitrososphaerota archaeon]MDG6939751.1 hypothetical protein [Nitrososphaerota archaeon]
MPEGENVWEWFGFRKNPYDFLPLAVNKEDRALFVGRDAELPRLVAPIESDAGGVTVVEGRAGVGKTSFVNVVQYDRWQSKSCLPSFQVLQVLPNTDPIGFVLSAFSTCMGSLELSNPRAADGDPYLKAGKAMVTQMLNSGWSFSGGLGVGLLGGQGGAGKTAAPSSPLLPAMPSILNTAGKWFDAASKLGWSKFIIPVNNLDMLDDESAANFMNVVRDYMITFAKKGVWWVLIAKEGFVHALENRAHRVSEILTGPPVKLNPLSLDEVKKAIDVRASKYGKGGAKAPVPDEIVSWLYKLSDGEVRAIFKKLTDMIFEYHATVPSAKTITGTAARNILIGEARRRIEGLNIQTNWIRVLERMVSKMKVYQGEFKDYNFNSQPAFRHALEKLCYFDLVRRKEAGREVMYLPTADTNLAFQKVNGSAA